MDAAITPMMQKHYPVLLKEIISIISPQYGGTFIDCTFGQGGYTKKILEFDKTRVIALDRDPESKNIASKLEEEFEERFKFKNIKFSQLNNLKLKNENVKGVIFDLGYSYTQIKDPNKGLSFDSVGKLNMQLGLNSYSAEEAINKLDQKELEKIFKFFGDEKEGKYIARNIVKERVNKKIDTQGLVKVIESSKRRKNFRVNNSTKTFQALRIFVNKEISELIYGLINAAKILKKDGVTLKANTIKADYIFENGENILKKIIAEDKVVLTKENTKATGQYMTYNLNDKIAKISGTFQTFSSPSGYVESTKNIIFDDVNNKAEAEGNVKIILSNKTIIYADNVKANFEPTNKSLKKAVAKGNVIIENKAKDRKSKADFGVYDANDEIIRLTGNVVIINQKSKLSGSKGITNLRTGISNIVGDEKNKKRVKGTFSPIKKQKKGD